jgi:hypothetical protein
VKPVFPEFYRTNDGFHREKAVHHPDWVFRTQAGRLGLNRESQDALEAFKAAIETGEMTGFKDGGMQAD